MFGLADRENKQVKLVMGKVLVLLNLHGCDRHNLMKN